MPHVDLLYWARRIWSRRLRQCNLSTLESRILGLTRVGDLHGREAPGRYFEAVPVLPATVYPRTAAGRPVPLVTTPSSMCIICSLVRSEIA